MGSGQNRFVGDLVLIGPTGVGKSTVARILGERLGRVVVSLDEVRFGYYEEIGYDAGHAAELRSRSFEELIWYWEPFNAYAVERCLASHSGAVFDFGAVHSVYDDPELFARVAAALAGRFIVLLVPSADPAESVRNLHERGRAGASLSESDLAMWGRILERFVTSSCNARLASATLYTEGLSPAAMASAILNLL